MSNENSEDETNIKYSTYEQEQRLTAAALAERNQNYNEIVDYTTNIDSKNILHKLYEKILHKLYEKRKSNCISNVISISQFLKPKKRLDNIRVFQLHIECNN